MMRLNLILYRIILALKLSLFNKGLSIYFKSFFFNLFPDTFKIYQSYRSLLSKKH